jgi:hypothetical protein
LVTVGFELIADIVETNRFVSVTVVTAHPAVTTSGVRIETRTIRRTDAVWRARCLR